MEEIPSATIDTALTGLQSGVTSFFGKILGLFPYIIVAAMGIWALVTVCREIRYWMGHG